MGRIGIDGAWYDATEAGVCEVLAFSSCEIVKRTFGGMEGGSCWFGVSADWSEREIPISSRMAGDTSDFRLRWETSEDKSDSERLFLCVRIDALEPGL